MAFLLKRTSTAPDSPMRIVVAQADGDEAGLNVGGTFFFEPAGKDGDQHQVSEHAAKVIMGDPGLAVHFECQPPLTQAAPVAPADGAATKKTKKTAAADQQPVE